MVEIEIRPVAKNTRIEARKGRVYLDSLRNGFGATVVAPYSLRRREKAPFSTPLAWKEVKPSLVPSNFNLGTLVIPVAGILRQVYPR